MYSMQIAVIKEIKFYDQIVITSQNYRCNPVSDVLSIVDVERFKPSGSEISIKHYAINS